MGTERDAGRSERTVYGLTDAGRAELRERVRRLLSTPDPDATLLVAALSFIACLPVPEADPVPATRRGPRADGPGGTATVSFVLLRDGTGWSIAAFQNTRSDDGR